MTLSLPHPPAWMDDASCASVGMTELWFPEHGGENAAAKSVCAGCIVKAECATYAAETKAYGIWAGEPLVAGRRIA